jgi:glycerol-3-phosphate dehydrogenase (NAD(P)+)
MMASWNNASEFWKKSNVALLGGGSFGTVLANIVAKNVNSVRVYVRADDQARAMNSTRMNTSYFPDLVLDSRIQAFSDYERLFDHSIDLIISALPSHATRSSTKQYAKFLTGTEIVLHATKGIEEGTYQRMSQVLADELPTVRIGVISGPNLSAEMAKNEPAATVVASRFPEVVTAGETILTSDRFRVYGARDVCGVEWAGTLKNIFAIAAGILDAKGFGFNTKALMLSRGLAEMMRFSVMMGADPKTFVGVAGVGDLIATCSSKQSRNFRVGFHLAQGESLDDVMSDLGQVAEGVRTVKIISEYAKRIGVVMPITETLNEILLGKISIESGLSALMVRAKVE